MHKLTDAQTRVLAWIGKGWVARRSHGSAIEVNGQRICNLAKMEALGDMGLAQRDAEGTWIAKSSGKQLVDQLGL